LIEQFLDTLASVAPGSNTLDHERLLEDATNPHARIERSERILEEELDLTPLMTAGRSRPPEEAPAVHEDLATVDFLKTDD
jgi:hypothetical protein